MLQHWLRRIVLLLGMTLAAGSLPMTVLAAGSTTPAGAIVFQTSSGGAIYAVQSDGAGLRYLTTGMDPALSPDGQWVAFTRWTGSQAGALGSLWVIGVNGQGERRVLDAINQPRSPMWSPDGQALLIAMQHGGNLNGSQSCFTFPGRGTRCFSRPADPGWGLRLVNVADSSYADLYHPDKHAVTPTWDPAQAWHVVYHGDNGLVNLDLNQGTTWTLTKVETQRAPVFSPDGTKLAFTFQQHDHWEVHVMNADGTGDVRLTQTPDDVIVQAELAGKTPRQWNNAAPAWSPDGKQIAFVTDRTGHWELWLMNADGSNQHPLLTAADAAKLNLQYAGMDERVISWR